MLVQGTGIGLEHARLQPAQIARAIILTPTARPVSHRRPKYVPCTSGDEQSD
jgi:hypothetical protein